MVPTATMAMLVSKEKSRMPLAHMNVAKHVRNNMNSVCHVKAKRIPSKKSTRYSIKVDHALFWLFDSPPPIVVVSDLGWVRGLGALFYYYLRDQNRQREYRNTVSQCALSSTSSARSPEPQIQEIFLPKMRAAIS
jgi:hypothetical protein